MPCAIFVILFMSIKIIYRQVSLALFAICIFKIGYVYKIIIQTGVFNLTRIILHVSFLNTVELMGKLYKGKSIHFNRLGCIIVRKRIPLSVNAW